MDEIMTVGTRKDSGDSPVVFSTQVEFECSCIIGPMLGYSKASPWLRNQSFANRNPTEG